MRTLAKCLAALLAACGDPGSAPPLAVADDWPVTVAFPRGLAPHYQRVVLVTIDTLRADHVSAYDYPRQTTPFFDALAAQGVLFTRARATISHTAPSHASMLTGLPPLVNGVLHNGYRMDEHAVDLARVFAAAGFETAACVNTEFLAGVAQSFQSVRPTTEKGAEVVRLAKEWLQKERTSERFFLWVHLFDPHRWKDFAVEVADEHLFHGKTPAGFEQSILELHGLTKMGTEGLLAQRWETVLGKTVELDSLAQYLRFVDAYDALVLYADQQLRLLFKALDDLRFDGPTLWVVTADHGEGLASHGIDGHGHHIYEEQLSVPLLLFDSERGFAPRRVDALVSHLDLYPTLLETLAGEARAPEGLLEGRSLWPFVRGESPDWSARTLFAQRKPGEEALYSLRDGRFKLFDRAGEGDELYDLARDPKELENRITEGLPEGEALARELERRLHLYQAHAQGPEEQELPAEWMDELRDLGYAR